MPTRPCVIIPGIQGSSLENFYSIDGSATWSTLSIAESRFIAPDFDSLALDDKWQADRAPTVVTRPSHLLGIAYAPLATGLQGRLGAPAFVFPYDWRYSITQNADLLVQYLARLKLKNMGISGWDGHFDFVCHSMGGLVFRAFLSAWGKSNQSVLPVGRLVFLATPHKGSLEAIKMLISGESPIFGGRKQLRKLARTFQSVYELLPTISTPIVQEGDPAANVFDVKYWQKNTVDPDTANSGFDVQQVHLTAAKAVLTKLPLPTDAPFKLPASDILVIYGNKAESTLRRVHLGPAPANWFNFDTSDTDDDGVTVPGAEYADGDDVVPVESALLNGIQSVEIGADDVSFSMGLIPYLAARSDLHAMLAALEEVGTVVARFFAGQPGNDLLPLGMPNSAYHP